MLLPLLLAIDLSRIAADAAGTVGISAMHLETGRRERAIAQIAKALYDEWK